MQNSVGESKIILIYHDIIIIKRYLTNSEYNCIMDDIQKTIYVLGSGFNQYLEDSDGFRPPLINNLFQIYLGQKLYNTDEERAKTSDLFKYIEIHWNKTVYELSKKDFNLEDIFTHFQLKLDKLKRDIEKEINGNNITALNNEYNRIYGLNFIMNQILAKVLNKFFIYCDDSDELMRFGERIFLKNPL